MIRIKRAYDPPDPHDGPRYLVDRYWPRGIRRDALQMVAWLRDAAPSPELCKWFGHEPEKWEEFQKRYTAELDGHPESLQPLLEAARQGDLVLLYGAREAEHNNAVALKALLEKHLED